MFDFLSALKANDKQTAKTKQEDDANRFFEALGYANMGKGSDKSAGAAYSQMYAQAPQLPDMQGKVMAMGGGQQQKQMLPVDQMNPLLMMLLQGGIK